MEIIGLMGFGFVCGAVIFLALGYSFGMEAGVDMAGGRRRS